MTDLRNKIEEFIASPQTERQYDGSIAVGFEMRRDLPKPFAGGIWFSAVAVQEILRASAQEAPKKETLIGGTGWCGHGSIASLCPHCVLDAINALSADEGDSVTILCHNPDPPPNVAIECHGWWTGWTDRRFEGECLLDALQAGVRAKTAHNTTKSST